MKKYAVLLLFERFWNVELELYSAKDEAQVRKEVTEDFFPYNPRILSITEIPRKE